jgi:hypothetical protein
MANEITILWQLMPSIPFTCADGATIEKGTLVKVSDPATVAITAADHDAVIGVTTEEKIANDGKVKVPVCMWAICKGTAGTAGVTAGACIDSDASTSAANKLADCAVNAENIIGRSFETATAGETFLFELKPYAANLA